MIYLEENEPKQLLVLLLLSFVIAAFAVVGTGVVVYFMF